MNFRGMSHTNASEAFYRLKDESPSNPPNNKELTRLRETMRKALQISEHQVESTRKQFSVNTKATVQNEAFAKMREKHDEAFEKIREKENAWQERCVAAETKLREITRISTQRNKLHNLNDVLCPTRAQPGTNDNKDIKDNEYQPNKVELVLKISSLDKAMSSLDQALHEMSKSTQDVKAELYNKEKYHPIKEKGMCDSRIQKDEHLNKLIICR